MKASCAALGLDVLVTPVSEFGKRCFFSILEYDPLLDSSNMTISEWRMIARDIERHYEEWDGFVVLHGTDTMAWTASILSFMLCNLSKTVILTGSQIPLSRPRNDGVDNLLGALNFATHFEIPEVCLYFANKLYRGNRSEKLHAGDFNAFGSPNLEPLATVGIGFHVNWPLIRKPSLGELQVLDTFCDEVTIFRIYPGPFVTMRSFLAPLKGVVMQTFGAGNAPDQDPEFLAALKEATDRGCVIVNITQCVQGEVEAHYAAGTALLEAGVTPGADMTPEAALTKLGWLLGCGYSPEQVRAAMTTDLRGELTVRAPSMKFSLQDGSFAKAVADALVRHGSMSFEGGDGITNNTIKFVREALMPTLMCTAASNGDLPELKSMLADGGEICSSDYDGRTPLHLACSEGKYEMTQFLLESKANVNVSDRFGYTPLRAAVASGRLEVIELVRTHGGRLRMPEFKLASVLCQLARENNAESLRLWCEAGADVNVADYDKRRALHLCAEVNSLASARVLLEHGADPNLEDRFGGSPMSIAVGKRLMEMYHMFQ
eukprot:TRINITY_DN5528_c0_g1_i3.p1 TRINITY_DN5528_c0_g1~~TRINITY_DN5528_c0_g1_i3.p1  ORF type:complete len:610 (-),score=93.79 TRINITY_DN5528_c0_g1_i3:302-1939(-)